MSLPVKLYVYDLSGGMARQLSQQLTGRQIDGIWHTSVVVYNREIFYGQGILETPPGQSHHGTPQQVLDMGVTAIDQETFEEYLSQMRSYYTADKYHLLDFNCNSFTNDMVGFLTGNSIPTWISDLPSDFLSTPFGAALRPTLDAMFRRPGAVPASVQPPPQAAAAPDSVLASALAQAVLAQSNGAGPSSAGMSTPSTATVVGPVHMCTNPTSFHNTLNTHRVVVAFFTSATCPPCRVIEPDFKTLAQEHTRGDDIAGAGRIAFVKVDIGAGLGGMLAQEYNVRATPTFIFFRDGHKTHDVRGANLRGLESQINLLLWETFPPHPHSQITVPVLDSLSTDPILFTQVPAVDIVLAKLVTFIDAAAPPLPHAESIKEALATEVLPFLKARFTPGNTHPAGAPASPQLLAKWAMGTPELADALPATELFPLVDLWRLALLDRAVGTWCAAQESSPISLLLGIALKPDPPRSYLLLAIRMMMNVFATPVLARTMLSSGINGRRKDVTLLLVSSLLHPDAQVRTGAASLAFNMAASIQNDRLRQVRARRGYVPPIDGADADWEIELVSAVLQAIQDETQKEDIVHRLTSALAFFLRYSPVYDSQLKPLLEVLQAKDTLKAKLAPGGCGPHGVQSPGIKKLVNQVATSLC